MTERDFLYGAVEILVAAFILYWIIKLFIFTQLNALFNKNLRIKNCYYEVMLKNKQKLIVRFVKDEENFGKQGFVLHDSTEEIWYAKDNLMYMILLPNEHENQTKEDSQPVSETQN